MKTRDELIEGLTKLKSEYFTDDQTIDTHHLIDMAEQIDKLLDITKPLTKQDLITQLNELNNSGDKEDNHCIADDLLVQYIRDEDITKAYNRVDKWYA